MKNLNYSLKELCSRNRDGSYSTQEKRLRTLQRCADLLQEKGYRKMSAQSLKPKHVEALVERWKADNLSPGSIKNNMTALRWWAEKIGKPAIIARDNDHYGIERRQFVTGIDKSRKLDEDKLSRIKDPFTKASLGLQEAFGLRREECIKFRPEYATATLDKGYIQLKDTWTKGGKERTIPVSTDPQMREKQLKALLQAQEVAGRGSMIPANKRYVDQLRAYERHTRTAGLSKLHGLRHKYAQVRYEQITGARPPAKGGISPKSMSQEERKVDDMARRQISRELGHERKQIVAIYLGG